MDHKTYSFEIFQDDVRLPLGFSSTGSRSIQYANPENYISTKHVDIDRLRRYGHLKWRRPPSWIFRTGNSAIKSAVHENPTIEPNMEWIGRRLRIMTDIVLWSTHVIDGSATCRRRSSCSENWYLRCQLRRWHCSTDHSHLRKNSAPVILLAFGILHSASNMFDTKLVRRRYVRVIVQWENRSCTK